jgi:hypothetical protein
VKNYKENILKIMFGPLLLPCRYSILYELDFES